MYAIDREHAKHIAAYYQSKGVRCAVIDAKTPAQERAKIVEDYKASSGIDVIVNVDIFSEGLWSLFSWRGQRYRCRSICSRWGVG